jgi:hypothetical protein
LIVEFKALKAHGSESLFVDASAPGMLGYRNRACHQGHTEASPASIFRRLTPQLLGVAQILGTAGTLFVAD